MPSKTLSIDEATLDTVSDSALKKFVRQTKGDWPKKPVPR